MGINIDKSDFVIINGGSRERVEFVINKIA